LLNAASQSTQVNSTYNIIRVIIKIKVRLILDCE
jgi:hypothetical protein